MSSEAQQASTNINTQGGTQGLGHVAAGPPIDTVGGFHSLAEQKSAAGEKYVHRAEESAGVRLSGGSDENGKEDASFMNRKPGGSQTLPGWEKAKELVTG